MAHGNRSIAVSNERRVTGRSERHHPALVTDDQFGVVRLSEDRPLGQQWSVRSNVHSGSVRLNLEHLLVAYSEDLVLSRPVVHSIYCLRTFTKVLEQGYPRTTVEHLAVLLYRLVCVNGPGH